MCKRIARLEEKKVSKKLCKGTKTMKDKSLKGSVVLFKIDYFVGESRGKAGQRICLRWVVAARTPLSCLPSAKFFSFFFRVNPPIRESRDTLELSHTSYFFRRYGIARCQQMARTTAFWR